MGAENGLKNTYKGRGMRNSLISACALLTLLTAQAQIAFAEPESTAVPATTTDPPATSTDQKPATSTDTKDPATPTSAGSLPASTPDPAKTSSTADPARTSASPADPAKANSSAAVAGKKRKNEFADVLPCLTWLEPDIDAKAILLCVHGLGLHNDSYEAFGKAMAKLGYLVYAVDVPGFGSFKQAEGRERVDFDYCLRGIATTLKFIHKVNPKLPVYILGESMGGAIALRFTSLHPELVDGLISSVPSGDRFNQNKETLRVGLKLLTAPNKEFDIGTSVIEKATQNDEVRKHWAEDPLNRMNLTPKELVRFQDFMNENHDSAKKIDKTPVLFVQGCKDKLVRPEGTMNLYNRIASEDRELELIHDGEHLIFEEGQFNDQVITMVDKWLLAHISKTKQLGSK